VYFEDQPKDSALKDSLIAKPEPAIAIIKIINNINSCKLLEILVREIFYEGN
jgi:hypothetical protein